MKIDDKPHLRELLAAQYALGTLRGRARRRFERWLADDPGLQVMVHVWQDRLVDWALHGRGVVPSPAVWQAIEARVRRQGGVMPAAGSQAGEPARGSGGTTADASNGRGRLDALADAIRFWRGWAFASTAVAVALAVWLALRPPVPAVPTQIASLSDEAGAVALVLTRTDERAALQVRIVALPPVPADRALELWAIDAAGQPSSLGLLRDQDAGRLPIAGEGIGALERAQVLAVSLEPRGGSPGPAPTGPVLYKGRWLRLQGT